MTTQVRRRWLWPLLGLLVLGWLSTSLFTIEETEIAIRTRFGRPLTGVTGPGFHLKAPWPIDYVERMDARLLLFDNEPSEMLTQDKKNVLVDSFITWRIADPLHFTQTVRNRLEAEARLLDISASELGAAIGSEPMESFLNTGEAPVRFAMVSEKVRAALDSLASKNFGIEVVDFRINGFQLPPQNRASVIQRMRAERGRIATRYRSEGEEAALKIEARTEADRADILAEARSKSEAIRGEGEAEALSLLGDAFSEDPEFYRFVRTLESYETIIDSQTTIFLESDSKLMKVLHGE